MLKDRENGHSGKSHECGLVIKTVNLRKSKPPISLNTELLREVFIEEPFTQPPFDEVAASQKSALLDFRESVLKKITPGRHLVIDLGFSEEAAGRYNLYSVDNANQTFGRNPDRGGLRVEAVAEGIFVATRAKKVDPMDPIIEGIRNRAKTARIVLWGEMTPEQRDELICLQVAYKLIF